MASIDGGYNFHSGPWTYGPIAGVQYTHLTVNSYTEQNSDADLAVNEDQTGSFSVRTDSPSRDSALVDAGLDAQLNDTVTLYADYLVEAGQSDYFGQSVQAGVRINF